MEPESVRTFLTDFAVSIFSFFSPFYLRYMRCSHSGMVTTPIRWLKMMSVQCLALGTSLNPSLFQCLKNAGTCIQQCGGLGSRRAQIFLFFSRWISYPFFFFFPYRNNDSARRGKKSLYLKRQRERHMGTDRDKNLERNS